MPTACGRAASASSRRRRTVRTHCRCRPTCCSASSMWSNRTGFGRATSPTSRRTKAGVPTGEGWLYLAVVIDLFSRQIVGFAMNERVTRQLVIDALRMAWFRRRPASGLIFHSDRGSQYASGDFQKQLAAFSMKGSMTRKGDCWDNAVTETLFGSLKVERLHGMCFATRRQAMDEIMDWTRFYNHRRMHSTLGYLSPMAYEKKRLGEKETLAA